MTDTAVEVWVSDPDIHDDDQVAHIVKKADANRGYFAQEVIEALCGYKWIPNKNPDKLPICHKCMDVAGKIRNKFEN